MDNFKRDFLPKKAKIREKENGKVRKRGRNEKSAP